MKLVVLLAAFGMCLGLVCSDANGLRGGPRSSDWPMLISSDWSSDDWSDGGKWGNASDWVQQGRVMVAPAGADEPWPRKLRVTVNDPNDSWIQMVLDGGPAPELGQPVTIRWYERVMLPDNWNADELTHGIALGNSNGGQPWLNYWTRTDGTYRMELQVLNDLDPMFAHRGWLRKGQWYRMEWTVMQETADRVRMAFHVYDIEGDEIYGPADFTDWPWADGQTSLAQKTWEVDLRAKQTKFVGWLSGLAELDRNVIWAEYAAVAIAIGDSVGAYDPTRGW